MKGTKVGSYIIEEKIGEGGMGVVYSARHDRMNGPAVVKMLRQQLAQSPQMAKRFENEATAAASIGHPGIVQVFDIGQHTDGSLYIVMEQLRGESLQTRLSRQGRLPIGQAIALVRQAAGALGAAHAAGIVHRDLKPDNMFIVPDPEVVGGERVKLLDFGIAKLASDGSDGMQTKTGAVLGTPHYMSPEQCQGAGDVDSRSDLYSLGCILFQLVTGRTPFIGAGAGDFIVAHMTQPPPSMRSLVPEVPMALENVVATLLAKNPAERFGSSEALANALGHIHVADAASFGHQPIPKTIGLAAGASTADARLARANEPTFTPPATTMGLSAGQSTRGIAAQGGMAASMVAPDAQRRKASKWPILAVLGVLSVAGLSIVLATRGTPTPPETSAIAAASESSIEAENSRTDEEIALAKEAELDAPLADKTDKSIAHLPKASLDKAAIKKTSEPKAGLTQARQPAKRSKQEPSQLAKVAADPLAPAKEALPSPPQEVEVTGPTQTTETAPKIKEQAAPPPEGDDTENNALVQAQFPLFKSKMQACASSHNVAKKQVHLEVRIARDGKVSHAKLKPPGLGGLARCIEDAAKEVRFRPRFRALDFKVPLFLQ